MSLLKKGDTVAFVAPSSFVKKDDITEAVEYFKQLGLKAKLAENITQQYPEVIKKELKLSTKCLLTKM